MATDNVSTDVISKSLGWKLRLFIMLSVTMVLLISFHLISVQRYGGTSVYSMLWKPVSSDSHLVSVINNSQGILSYKVLLGKSNVPQSNLQELNVSESDLMRLNVTISQYQSYLQMLKDYNERLAAIPRHQYGPSEKYITYGEPLSKLRPNNTNNTGPRIILAWTGFFGNWGWIPKNITCHGGLHCIGSTNKNEYEKSDLVVMHAGDMSSPTSLPQTRSPHQIWLYFLQESPYHAGIPVRRYNGVFNWTATYRQDSDIPVPYFGFKARENNLSETDFSHILKNIMSTKQKHIVASMYSNCGAPHTQRLKYIAELKKYMPVDTYGRCGSLNCPRNKKCTAILSQYKFYLSMENSHCRDYITEKAVRPLVHWNSVPVVMGADDPGNYAELLPPNSYIHTSGFKSPKELAEYLLLLDANPALYEKYHRWRITHQQSNKQSFWCQACLKLQNASLPSQTYRDFIGWYNEDICKS